MKKTFLALSLVCFAANASATSHDVQGFRIDGGVESTTLYSDINLDLDGFNVGVGYDINKYLGVIANYAHTTLENKYKNKYRTLNDIKVNNYLAGVDLGYTFTPNKAVFIKPYLSVGYIHSVVTVDSTKAEDSGTASDSNLFVGLGVRMTILQHVTLSLEGRSSEFQGGKHKEDGFDLGTGSFNIGYKF